MLNFILDTSSKKQSAGIKILTDEEEEISPILGYKEYADSIVKIVKGSTPNFSIGIYGDWGTGKSTLMRLIEKKLKNDRNEITVRWVDLEKKTAVLKRFLIDNYDVEWINSIDFLKTSPDTMTISGAHKQSSKSYLLSPFQRIRQFVSPNNNKITDINKTVSINLDRKKSKAILKINDDLRDEFTITIDENEIVLHLRENDILTVWFNAWRYEREDKYALIALLKTIAYAMGDLHYYKEIKRILQRGIGIITRGILRNLAAKYVMTEKSFDELEKKLSPKMDLLSKVDKDTIYFDGLHMIEQEMDKITKNNNRRIVVFIDDLDRCSPKTTLELFESIKVFLGMKGFVYVIGLSDKTIFKLISTAYKDLEIKGEDYIRKIIQIPINLPEWKSGHIIDSLLPNLAKDLSDPYNRIISDKENGTLISKAVEPNPREVKRFINNFIVAHDMIIENKRVTKMNEEYQKQAKELLVVHALRRWNNFYKYITQSSLSKFKGELKEVIDLSHEQRNERIENKRDNEDNEDNEELESNIFEFYEENDLWDFLKEAKEIILEMSEDNWNIYLHATESVKKDPSDFKDKLTEISDEADKYYREGNKANALKSYGQLIDIDPNNIKALFNKAKILVNFRRHREAVKYYDRLLELDPGNTIYLNNKAYSLAHINQYEEAQSIIDIVLENKPKWPKALDTKGYILLRSGKNLDEAKRLLEEAVEMKPTYANCKHLAEVYEKLGEVDKAKENREKAEKLKRKRMKENREKAEKSSTDDLMLR